MREWTREKNAMVKATAENIVRIVPDEKHSYRLVGLNNVSVASETKQQMHGKTMKKL